jgi:hypothetical protein
MQLAKFSDAQEPFILKQGSDGLLLTRFPDRAMPRRLAAAAKLPKCTTAEKCCSHGTCIAPLAAAPIAGMTHNHIQMIITN